MTSNRRIELLRERLAFKIAPWLQRRYSEHYDRAFGDLAEVAYGSRDAIWTSPTTLVHVALREASPCYCAETSTRNCPRHAS